MIIFSILGHWSFTKDSWTNDKGQITIDEFHILRSTVAEAFKPAAYLGITITGFTDFARCFT
ncbi:MAG: hypothetical protein Fur0025_09290 [Oscillatoriaceae cyanobacterium]